MQTLPTHQYDNAPKKAAAAAAIQEISKLNKNLKNSEKKSADVD
jgi:hypothetical protein